MCTATWLRDASGYRVFFNRDELRSRPAATPPAVERSGGVRYLAPRDSEAGGTWLAANELGLTVGVLNLYRVPSPTEGDFTSRGLLVADAVGATSAADLERRLSEADLSAYRPFTLFAVSEEPPARVWDWDGRRLAEREEPEQLPLASSSLADQTAERARRELFDSFARGAPLSAERLLEFQRSHRPEKGALSPCMHRPEAATVSLSVVEMSPDRVRLLYGAGPACTATLASGPELSRRE